MKNLILTSIFFVLLSLNLQAQEDRFTSAMTALITEMENPNPNDVDWSAITNKLERIAAAEPEQWLPQYYLSYAGLQLALREMNQGNVAGVEQYVKVSETHLDKAKALTEMNSELKCMEGYVLQGYIWIDPMANGSQYAGAAHAAYAEAAAMDETNPRPLMLRGMLVLFTPEFFGGGAENAMPLLQGAEQLYALEGDQDRGILPRWGAGTSNWMLNKAQTDLAAKDE